jgi:hypothetical protein
VSRPEIGQSIVLPRVNRLCVNHFCSLRENQARDTTEKNNEAASVIRKAILGACVLALSACAGGGPGTRAILGEADSTVASRAETLPYIVVDVDREHRHGGQPRARRHAAILRRRPPGPVIIGVGDTVQVSIVSSSESGFLDFTTAQISPISTTSACHRRPCAKAAC